MVVHFFVPKEGIHNILRILLQLRLRSQTLLLFSSYFSRLLAGADVSDLHLRMYGTQVGDMIKVKQKEEMWSWGVLERGGAEGW